MKLIKSLIVVSSLLFSSLAGAYVPGYWEKGGNENWNEYTVLGNNDSKVFLSCGEGTVDHSLAVGVDTEIFEMHQDPNTIKIVSQGKTYMVPVALTTDIEKAEWDSLIMLFNEGHPFDVYVHDNKVTTVDPREDGIKRNLTRSMCSVD